MFTNTYDLAIYVRKKLSDRGGMINPVRRLSPDEFRIFYELIAEAFAEAKKLPFKKGYLEYEPGRTNLLRLMNQIDLPDRREEQKIIPFRKALR